jgi:2-methylcitrate dehydratase PrpD
VALELSDALGSYAVSVKLTSLAPTEVVRMVDAFVNWVGCAVGGSHTNTVDAAARALISVCDHGGYTSFGRRERFCLVDAISIDCLSSAAHGFDDTHLETILHPTGPVAAALLGAARVDTISGARYLESLLVGMEVECRVGLAFASREARSKRGWYATGLAGGIGAAAGVGRVLGFTEEQMCNAFGLAAARACGNRGTHGTMAGAYVPALAAESGFMAAKLTQAGFTCGARALDGSNGMLELISATPAIERGLRGLGSVSEATRTAFKPYPAGIVLHAVIDACLSLVQEHGVASDQVESIDLRVPQAAYDLAAKKHPKDELEASVSIFHWAAATLVTGAAGIAQAGPQIVRDRRVRAFQDRISISASADLEDDQCRAFAKLTDGRVIEVWIEHAIGSVDRPMSSVEVDRKFFANTRASYGDERADRLLRACRNIVGLDNVAQILEI